MRKFIFALLNTVKTEYGYQDLSKFYQATKDGYGEFSVMSCTKEEFDNFVQFIIEDVLENNFQSEEFMDFVHDDLDHFTRACIKQNKCVVCGKDSDTVAMQKSARRYYISLCSEHKYEYDVIGVQKFLTKYHIKPVRLT